MTSEPTEELRIFLRDHVSSFEELEVLLFFARSPQRAWTAAELAAVLDLPEELLASAIERLTQHLLTRDQRPGAAAYRYAARDGAALLVERLSAAYDQQRLAIVQIMTANAVERVRSTAARQLAEAFRLDKRTQ